ncbi:MAG: hypothetical protein GX626_04970 [Spirochaetales bacterium]|jgi:hypothetical protein|nr:hypothetical protein [Spirochaetales bacterium]
MKRLLVVKEDKILRSCILLLFASLFCFPLFSSPAPLLPIDKNIGQIIAVEPQSVEEQAKRSLSQDYSLAWIETYVPDSLRTGFVHTYDRLLAALLPLEQIQMATHIQRGHLLEVPFCHHAPAYGYGSMTWMQNEDGKFVLLSLSVHE